MIVIDTHIWIWYLDKPDLLSEKSFAVVEHAKERKAIYISSISVWEICVLEKKGRLQFSIPAAQWIRKSENLSFLHFVPVTNEIVRRSVALSGDLHPDPADRLIIATACMKRIPLVTKDRKIQTYPAISTIW
jgi:PIN domain nuclease of toxin-antitoxin system